MVRRQINDSVLSDCLKTSYSKTIADGDITKMAKEVIESTKIRLELMRLIDHPEDTWKNITKNILHG